MIRSGRRIVAAASVGAALIAGHTAFNARRLRTPATPPPHAPPTPLRVSALVPARDEASRIGPCVRALLDSTGVPELEVVVLDDGSTDGTTDRARLAGRGDPRLRVLPGAPLRAGWLGKPHACAQLAEAAGGDVLVFVDADVTVSPWALRATVDLMETSGLDLVCPYPRQLADGVGPRLVQPLLQWSWLAFLPLRLAERSSRPSLTAANGQLLACVADAYQAAGGHHTVRAEVIEDVALARAFKAAGATPGMADGTDLAACRMYDGWPQLREGYTKSLWAAFRSPAGAAGVMALLGTLFVLPAAAALRALLRGRPREALLPGAGYAAGVASRVVSARRTGGRSHDAVWHPLSVLTLAWLTARSVWHHRAGRLQWKGRPLPAGRDGACTADGDGAPDGASRPRRGHGHG